MEVLVEADVGGCGRAGGIVFVGAGEGRLVGESADRLVGDGVCTEFGPAASQILFSLQSPL